MSRAFLLAFLLVSLSTPVAEAGELVGEPRIGGGGVPDRDIRKSTAADQALSRRLGVLSNRSLSLREANPYEARILDHQRAQEKYQQDLQRWEIRAAKLQEQKELRLRREQERLQEKRRRDAERLRRERRRLEKKERGDVFSTFRGSDKIQTQSSEDEKSRRAEEFFGGSKGPEKAEKPRLSFWQRLKRALFGG